jgi:peptidoglycan/xylan/chitin deacetylase (PgdA/CDA1 family)
MDIPSRALSRALSRESTINYLFSLPVRLLARDKLSVFVFHKVPQTSDVLMPQDLELASFERLLDTVISAFRVMPLADAAEALHRGKLPSRAACITFDDGYPSWINGVVPALQRRNLQATFFITTGQFFGRPLWHERIANAVQQCHVATLKLPHPALVALPLQTPQQRTAAVLYLERSLKYLTLSARNDLLLALEDVAGASCAQVPIMPLADLRAIHALGFGIGAHTDDHPILAYCDDASARREIGQTREELCGLIGGPVDCCAYPNGHPFADFSSRHVELVKQAGYTSAVTTQWGVATTATSPFQIPRFTPWGNKPLNIAWQLGRNLLTQPECVDE